MNNLEKELNEDSCEENIPIGAFILSLIGTATALDFIQSGYVSFADYISPQLYNLGKVLSIVAGGP